MADAAFDVILYLFFAQMAMMWMITIAIYLSLFQ